MGTRKQTHAIASLIKAGVVAMSPVMWGGMVAAQENINIANGGNLLVDTFGTCKIVTNNTGHALYVPVYSAGEWTGTSGFIQKHGANITVSDCAGCSSQTVNWSPGCSGTAGALSHGGSTSVTNTAGGHTGSVSVSCYNGTLNQSSPSCVQSGVQVGGYWWYLGADGQSCTTVCSTHSGYNAATVSYAGSGGTLANCHNVSVALGKPGTGTDWGSCAAGFGCIYMYAPPYFDESDRCPTPATTADASNAGVMRFCACNN
ncbi:MAG: hypothetical protein WC421_05865 [Elusimicrobiales bacterium]